MRGVPAAAPQITIRATLRVETPLTTISMCLTPHAVFQAHGLHDAKALKRERGR
jgi:hypothetical protein